MFQLLFVLLFAGTELLAANICSAKGGIPALIKTVVDIIVVEKGDAGDFFGGGKRESSGGTGFIIDENGYIATNCHVIESAQRIKIILYDGREYVGKVVGKDERSDIALLKIDSESRLPFAQLADSDKAKVGDIVMAVGNPFGFGKTVTSGIISYIGRNLSSQISELGVGGDLVSYMQTDAAVTLGNSGGPLLLAESGEVVAMMTAFFSDEGHGTGLNFAIPSKTLKKVINQLRDDGVVHRSWIGISVSPISKSAALALGCRQPNAAVITRVEADSPASVAGVQTGDILLSINDESIPNDANIEYILSNLPSGSVIPIQVIRHMTEMKLSVKVGIRNEDDFCFSSEENANARVLIPRERIDDLGISVTNLTPNLRETFEIPDNVNGVLISQVDQNPDISVGDVIVMVNQIVVPDVSKLKATVQKISSNEDVKKRGLLAFYVFDSQTKRYDYVAIDIKKVQPIPVLDKQNPQKSLKKEKSKMAKLYESVKNSIKLK
jgi:serine protease Do